MGPTQNAKYELKINIKLGKWAWIGKDCYKRGKPVIVV